ncbi:MAG: hypothetical protein JRF15_01505 [Deltaproteobacteria bacterium]|nr:hypothetical protein [Deltaproteobacteria bacterium]
MSLQPSAPENERKPRRRRWPARGFALAVLLAPLAAMAFERGDRLSHLGDSDTASEYWHIVAHFDSGHHLFARFLITNEGPGDRTAIATWLLLDPNGKRTDFRNGRREKRWTLSPEGDRIEIGSSIFDRSAAPHRLEYDSTKRGIRVAFEYAPKGPIGWPESADDRYPFDLLELETPVTGTIWLEGMAETASVRGTISISHTWMDQNEADLALRRIEFSSTGGAEPALYLSERLAPSGEREGWLAVVRDGKLLYQTGDFELDWADPPNPNSGDYPTPTELRIRGTGLDGVIQTGPRLADINPLEAIPQPFRFLLSFKLRPHRVWARASFEVRLLVGQDTPGTVLKGSGITTVTYTNPSPRK